MNPTNDTRWFYLMALSMGASATVCTRAGCYDKARCFADQAKEFWIKVRWEL